MSLLEVLLASAIGSIALLSHAAGTLGGHRLGEEERHRTLALNALHSFVECVRAEEDWSGLYTELRAKCDAPPPGAKAMQAGPVCMLDARRLHVPTAYYPDWEASPLLGAVGVIVDVPSSEAMGASSGDPRILREDADLPEYGLPYDLDASGALSTEDRSADYLALPVRITFQYQPPGESPHVMRVLVWLRGER